MTKTHRDLAAWKMAMDLVRQVYLLTSSFPDDERYGLTQQTRRSAVSVPSNIAEGAARETKKEFIRYLYIARGSLSELQTQLEIARQLKLGVLPEEALKHIDQLFSVIIGLIRQLRNKPPIT